MWDNLLLNNINKYLYIFLKNFNILKNLYVGLIYPIQHVKCYCSENFRLNPWFITGFVDAEGCFNINVTKSSTNLIGYQVQARFIIEVNIKDKNLLNNIQAFFGGIGSITCTKNVARYSVYDIKNINNIIKIFNEYPLQSSKQIDFTLWKQCVNLILNKKHLTSEGLEKILSYKTAMNFGESERLKLLFPNIVSMEKPTLEMYNSILNPYWVTGFIEGEGSFHINTKNTYEMRPVFSIGLNQRDKFLLIKINNFFKEIGSVYMSSTNNSAELKVYKLYNFASFIDHFNNYPLIGFKLYNFTIWCEIVKLLENKELTPEILDKINDLKNKLNKWN